MKRYALGLDFGTNSCRSLIVDLDDGTESASAVFDYPSGAAGILLDPNDPNVARQNPQDYLDGLVASVRGSTRSSPRPRPALRPRGRSPASESTRPGARRSPSTPPACRSASAQISRTTSPRRSGCGRTTPPHAEAEEITELARRIRPQFLARCGGTYSSEWWWSKILHLKRTAPDVFAAAHSFVEHCDWIPATAHRSDQSRLRQAQRLRRRPQGDVQPRLGRTAGRRISFPPSIPRSPASVRDSTTPPSPPTSPRERSILRLGASDSASNRAQQSPSAPSTSTWAPSRPASAKAPL